MLIKNNYFVGLMSGTSLDGIDAALVNINDNGNLNVVSVSSLPFPARLSTKLRQLIAEDHCVLHDLGSVHTELGELYAATVNEIIKKSNFKNYDVVAIGSHGQTLRHSPDGKHPYSIQIGNASVISELTGITTISDFRSRDIAAGGQGAPLVPAFHQAVFSNPNKTRTIVNIGGISNITLLPDSNSGRLTSGYDTGPGNCLLDSWSSSCRGIAYDDNGTWGETGVVNHQLLNTLLSDSFFSKSSPKSTGTEHFNLEWVESKFPKINNLKAEDVQATLTELTAHTIAIALIRESHDKDEVYLCGGGVHNSAIKRRLQNHLIGSAIFSTEKLGLDPDFVEATAFAWLAWCTINKKTGNLPSVTGAQHPVILGGIYPA